MIRGSQNSYFLSIFSHFMTLLKLKRMNKRGTYKSYYYSTRITIQIIIQTKNKKQKNKSNQFDTSIQSHTNLAGILTESFFFSLVIVLLSITME